VTDNRHMNMNIIHIQGESSLWKRLLQMHRVKTFHDTGGFNIGGYVL